MKYRCVCGNISYISFDNFKKCTRCKQCGLKKQHDKLRHNIDEVRNYFLQNNCVPLFDEYINDRTPLKFQCSCGNISEIRFADFKRGRRCNKCRVERILKSNYVKNNFNASLQQIYLHKLFGGELNYPIGSACLDIAFIEDKIYLEYDGSGHDLSVKLGTITQNEFNEKEKRRKYALYRRGWKEIRIKSRRDYFPQDGVLLSMYQFALETLKNSKYIIFDIDNETVEYNNQVFTYNYGKLKRLRNDYAS